MRSNYNKHMKKVDGKKKEVAQRMHKSLHARQYLNEKKARKTLASHGRNEGEHMMENDTTEHNRS